MLKFIIPHIFTLIPKEWKGVVGEYITRKKPTQHFVEPAFILFSKTAATYSPTVTQYHRRDEA